MTEAAHSGDADTGLHFQRCGGGGHTWYFQRDFCPACGSAPLKTPDIPMANQCRHVPSSNLSATSSETRR